MASPHFTTEQARVAATALNISWRSVRFDTEQFCRGMDVELEHGKRHPQTNVTDDDPLASAKIALAHLREFPDYYTRLSTMEREADIYWKNDK